MRILGYITRRLILCAVLVMLILLFCELFTDIKVPIEDVQTLSLMYFSALWGIMMGDWT